MAYPLVMIYLNTQLINAQLLVSLTEVGLFICSSGRFMKRLSREKMIRIRVSQLAILFADNHQLNLNVHLTTVKTYSVTLANLKPVRLSYWLKYLIISLAS